MRTIAKTMLLANKDRPRHKVQYEYYPEPRYPEHKMYDDSAMEYDRGRYPQDMTGWRDETPVSKGRKMAQKLDERDAKEWMRTLKNADGSTGAHWTKEHTDNLRSQYNISCDPMEFWCAVNMLYSDYCTVAKAYNVCTAEFFAKLAVAFLDDVDAVSGKLSEYWDCVVKH